MGKAAEIGIFYGSTSGSTEEVAGLIQKCIGAEAADLYDIATARAEDLNRYHVLILGTSTTGDGELQDDWEAAAPLLKQIDYSNKKIALWGLGDQEGHPDTFADALGILYRLVMRRGAYVIGEWSPDDYGFDKSRAYRDGNFVGLVIDQDNQPEMTEQRVADWVEIVLSAI